MEIHFILKTELPAMKVCVHFGKQPELSSPCDLPLILLSWQGGARRPLAVLHALLLGQLSFAGEHREPQGG